MGKFDDCFKPKKFSEIEERMRNSNKRKEILYRAEDSEIRQALKDYGIYTDFIRVGNNVVIADNCIAVIIKLVKNNYTSVYLIDGEDLPIDDNMKENIRAKRWATQEVIKDIRMAEEILLEDY